MNFYINTRKCIPTDIFCYQLIYFVVESAVSKKPFTSLEMETNKLKTKALKIRLQGIKVGGRKRFEKSCCLKSHLGYFLSFTRRLSRLGASFLKEPPSSIKNKRFKRMESFSHRIGTRLERKLGMFDSGLQSECFQNNRS